MTLRIAFSGAHGTGKDTLTTYVSDLLHEALPSEDIWVLDSATRYVSELTGEGHSEETDDWTQLWSSVTRRMWEFAHANHPIILSPRCGIDEISYEQNLANVRRTTLESAMQFIPQIPMGKDAQGNDQFALREEQAMQKMLLDRSMAVLLILVEQAGVETEWWDFIYWKRPLKSVPIENDGHRSTNDEFQEAIDRCFEAYLVAPSPVQQVLSRKVRELPRDIDEAKAFLANEVDEWIEKHQQQEESDDVVS